MITFLTVVHILVCLLLTISVLLQSGKGGGLAEGFSSAENLLGAQTNVVMIRITTVLGICFLVTCISLAILTAKSGRSLMARALPQRGVTKTVDVDKLFDQAPVQTITLNAEVPADVLDSVRDEMTAAQDVVVNAAQ